MSGGWGVVRSVSGMEVFIIPLYHCSRSQATSMNITSLIEQWMKKHLNKRFYRMRDPVRKYLLFVQV